MDIRRRLERPGPTIGANASRVFALSRPLRHDTAEETAHGVFAAAVFRFAGLHPEALRHLVVECGASQIVLGTDSPYPWTSTAVEHILGTPSLSDADREAILGGTAAKLPGIAA